jgi:hypothetical protein
MRPRIAPACLAIVALIVMAFAACRTDSRPRSPITAATSAAAQPLAASTCHGLWEGGFELKGVVGGRQSQAYFDTWPAPGNGGDDLISGIVVFPESPGVLADAVTGLRGRKDDVDCEVQFEDDSSPDGSIWQLRIENSRVDITGTRRLVEGRSEPVAFTVVPETMCDGAGEWRTFGASDWPITFEYPASWKLTADQDDINIECPSVTGLAIGGSFLTFERGRFPPPGTRPGAPSGEAFTEPYWFVKRPGDVWRVKDLGCDPEGPREQPDRCAPARMSERNGMTLLQGAAGEHRLYRPGVGYLGQGGGIARYLWILGDRWISLDSTEWTHFDDIRSEAGPALIDGDDVGERVVRSLQPRR